MTTRADVTPTEAFAHVSELIEKHTAEGVYTAPLVATQVVAELRAHDPGVLDAWLDAQAEHFVTQAIGSRDKSRRAIATRAGRSAAALEAYRSAADAADAGDPGPLRDFLAMPVTRSDQSRIALGKCHKDDLLDVAGTYRGRERANALYAAFTEALARKVGKRAVEDIYSNEQLAAMWDSLDR